MIVVLPTLLYDVIKHNFWATSAIPLWEISLMHFWASFCVKSALLYHVSLNSQGFWWNYSILHPYFKWHDCLIHALFLSLQYQVPVYWSYFDLRRGEDQWQPKKKDECDVLFTALHLTFCVLSLLSWEHLCK